MAGDKVGDFFETWFERNLSSDSDATTKMYFRAAFYGGVEVALFMAERLDPAFFSQAMALWKAEMSEFEKQLDAVRHVANDETKQ